MFENEIKQYMQKHGFERFAPQAVLFDMDGVLYNSMPSHAVAWQQSMAQFGIRMTAADSYATEGARGVDTIVRFVNEQQGRDITLDEAQRMYEVKADIFHHMPTAPVFDGVFDIMRKIKEAGMSICIVTGSGQRPLLERLVDDFGQFIDEQHIVSAYDVERGKPAPDPYLMGMRKTGCTEPWQAVVVENAPLGVAAGSAARCFTVGINSGPLPDEALSANGADIVLPDMRTFVDHWEQLLAQRR